MSRGHHIAGAPQFDDEGEIVGCVGFEYPNDEQADTAELLAKLEAARDAAEVLQKGILHIAKSGHADAIKVRCYAFLRILDFYHSNVEAAKIAKVKPATIRKAVERLRAELSHSKNKNCTGNIGDSERAAEI